MQPDSSLSRRARASLRYDRMAERGETRPARDALVRRLDRVLGAGGTPVPFGGQPRRAACR
jgi:hypothetical protein